MNNPSGEPNRRPDVPLSNQEDAMQQPTTSRDIASSEGGKPSKDSQREQEKAMIKDANETDQAERDAIHGDGNNLGITEK
jgi:hypothetical protein